MTLPSDASSYSAVSSDSDKFIRHVLISWIMALLFGMENNANINLDRQSLFNNLLMLVGSSSEQQDIDRAVMMMLVQRYLDRLIEKGFVEEDKGSYSLTELGQILGDIKFRAVKEKILSENTY